MNKQTNPKPKAYFLKNKYPGIPEDWYEGMVVFNEGGYYYKTLNKNVVLTHIDVSHVENNPEFWEVYNFDPHNDYYIVEFLNQLEFDYFKQLVIKPGFEAHFEAKAYSFPYYGGITEKAEYDLYKFSYNSVDSYAHKYIRLNFAEYRYLVENKFKKYENNGFFDDFDILSLVDKTSGFIQQNPIEPNDYGIRLHNGTRYFDNRDTWNYIFNNYSIKSFIRKDDKETFSLNDNVRININRKRYNSLHHCSSWHDTIIRIKDIKLIDSRIGISSILPGFSSEPAPDGIYVKDDKGFWFHINYLEKL